MTTVFSGGTAPSQSSLELAGAFPCDGVRPSQNGQGLLHNSPAPLHEYPGIGQPWAVHSSICPNLVHILRTIFWVMENLETNCSHA